jgi:uncharacterized protein (DUF983 family)
MAVEYSVLMQLDVPAPVWLHAAVWQVATVPLHVDAVKQSANVS